MGPGNPGLGDDVRIINEGFADFFAGQVASATDYFTPGGSDVSDGTREGGSPMWPSWVVEPEDAGLALMVRAPGLDRNYWNNNDVAGVSIGRISTLLHDLFDGRPLGDLGPTSATGWVSPPTFEGPTFTDFTGAQDPTRWPRDAVVPCTTGVSWA